MNFEFSKVEYNMIVSALFDKLTETKQYLNSYKDIGDEPSSTDTCCEAHLSRYQYRIREKESLIGCKELIENLLSLFPHE